MEEDRLVRQMIQRSNPVVLERLRGESDGSYVRFSDFVKKEAENKALKEEVTRLKLELAEAKRQAGRFHDDILMYSAVDTLLHQAKSLSTLIYERERRATRLKNDQ